MSACFQHNTEATKSFVTQGTWDVTSLVGYDGEEKLVYVEFNFVSSRSLVIHYTLYFIRGSFEVEITFTIQPCQII